jgi:vacuolar-type H+-ATPase subunit I/STV1
MEKITGEVDIEGSLFFHLSIENSSKFLSSALSTNNTLLLPALSTQLSSSSSSATGASGSQEKNSSSVANNLFASLRKDLLEVARSKDSHHLWKKTSSFSREKKDQILEKMSASATGSSQLEEAIETANELISELEEFMEKEEQSPGEAEKNEKVDDDDDDDDDDTKGKVHSIQKMFFASSKTNDFFAVAYDNETHQR